MTDPGSISPCLLTTLYLTAMTRALARALAVNSTSPVRTCIDYRVLLERLQRFTRETTVLLYRIYRDLQRDYREITERLQSCTWTIVP